MVGSIQRRQPWSLAGLVVVLLASTAGCNAYSKGRVEEGLSDKPVESETVGGSEAFLKAHMADGDVYIFRDWTVRQEVVRGRGVKYTSTRYVDSRGIYRLPIDEVAIFETNKLQPSGAIIGMTVLTGLSAILSGYCLAVNKACFGSCPTFYAGDREPSESRPGAEAFSHAVAPSLESTDLDRLSALDPSGERAMVRMTNEAMETHVVRSLQLLAAERPEGWSGPILQDGEGRLRAVSNGRGPRSCEARNGPCNGVLSARDGTSWSSRADAEDLTTRETVRLTYDAPDEGRAGLAVTFRQTFITTFLFYQFLSDLGPNAVDFIAEFERSDKQSMEWFQRTRELMGGIAVDVRRDGDWRRVGEVWEAGPIASNTRVIELPEWVEGRTKVRFRLAKGNWRIDAARMVRVGPTVEPEPLALKSATYDGDHPDAAVREAKSRVSDDSRTLATRRGDAYTFRFERPEEPGEYAYYLKARGYYLEWMRDPWLRESNPWRAAQMVTWPSRALKRLAPEFKKREEQMEKRFWESRYVPSN